MFELKGCANPSPDNKKQSGKENNLDINLRILERFSIKGSEALQSWKKIENIIKKQ